MKNLRILYNIKILICFLVLHIGIPFNANASVEDFLKSTITGLFNLFTECQRVPTFNHFRTGTKMIEVSNANPGSWISANHRVEGGKMLKIDWSTLGITLQPRHYKVLYRIDPRFLKPQLFILKLNPITNVYESDFHNFKSGALVRYQANPNLNFTDRIKDYDDYFNFVGRSNPLTLSPGDKVNIALIDIDEFFKQPSNAVPNIIPDFSSELDPPANLAGVASIITTSSFADNKILYIDSLPWCQYLEKNNLITNDVVCTEDPATGSYVYAGSMTSYNRLLGLMDPSNRLNSFPSCPVAASGPSTSDVCLYDGGRGMKIFNNNKQIKGTYAPFMSSEFSGKKFFYYEAQESGTLTFDTPMYNSGSFAGFTQSMKLWRAYGSSTNEVKDAFLSLGTMSLSNFLQMGRYVMTIQIGSSGITNAHQQDLRLEYVISDTVPSNANAGTAVPFAGYSVDAPISGNLWLRVTNPHDEIAGTITARYSGYTGDTFLSNLIYDSIVEPVMDLIRQTAGLFYSAIATNPTWQLTVRTILTLYIIFYSLYFLSGMIEVSARDLVERVIKIAVILAMFSPSSWKFFNDKVFNMFLDGMSYLVVNVVGATSSTANPFGFIDVIFDTYTNPQLWFLLLIELLQIFNGMTYLAILMISAILTYLVAVIEVVVSYIMAFITMSVLISLAPLFIVCMLFERTKGMFDNWFSLLFNYMIHPTILILFFILLDDLMINQLNFAIVDACWDWFFKIHVDLDLRELGVDFRIKFDIPMLPGIPFFVPHANAAATLSDVENSGTMLKIAMSSLMFFIYSQLAAGLTTYVTQVVSALTNVKPIGKEADPNDPKAPTDPSKAITNQIKSVTVDPVKKAGDDIVGGIKRKAGGDYSAGEAPKATSEHYKKKEAASQGKEGANSGGIKGGGK